MHSLIHRAMSERRRLLMAQGEEDNPWEKIDYLTIVPLEGGAVIDIYPMCEEYEEYDDDGNWVNTMYYRAFLQYRYEGGSWQTLDTFSDKSYETIITTGPVQIRATTYRFYEDYHNSDYFYPLQISCDNKIALAGTVDSLIEYELSGQMYTECFSYLFRGCRGLIKILNPKTFFKGGFFSYRSCYGMFSNCLNLTNAPELNLTGMGEYAFSYMFIGCTSLTKAMKEINTTTISRYGCSDMFRGCSSLIEAPRLPAESCYAYAYTRMFLGCTSLIKAPDLPILYPGYYAYVQMFKDCSSLRYIRAMLMSIETEGYPTTGWLSGVASEGTFVKNKNATWNVTGVNGVPTGWTVITE